MTKFNKKRDSLERFIREQTLGPGACGYRYIDTKNKFISRQYLSKQKPIDYKSEILNTVPGLYYSTGILFPEDNSKKDKYGENRPKASEITENIDDKEEDIDSNDSETITDEEDTIEASQRYPRTMGITLCLNKQDFNDDFIEFKISFRHYRKIPPKKNEFNDRYGLLLEVDNSKSFLGFIKKYGLDSFYVKKVGKNEFLMSSKLNQEKIRKKIKEIEQKISVDFLENWKKKEVVDIGVKRKEYLNNIKNALLKNFVKSEHLDERLKLYEFIQEIEEKEIYLEHFQNLLNVKSSNDYGLWKSNYIERLLRIKGLNAHKSISRLTFKNELNDNISVYDENLELVSNGLKDIYKFKIDASKNDFASISANIQLSNDSRSKEEKVFLKIQLVNTSTSFQSTSDKSFYSIANEKVNLKTFFGVQIKLENKNLVPYSSPIDSKKRISDDEENINLMLYKDQKVYGIGHGCSIIHEIEGNKKAIMTEYIPHFDTPDVEFITRKKGELILKEGNSNIYIDAPLFQGNKIFAIQVAFSFF